MATVLEQILDLGRWAPSGDNTQPWRFEILGERALRVHGFDTRAHCVYDLDGHPSQLSQGALIETLAIAAHAHGLRMDVERDAAAPEDRPRFDLRFTPDPALPPHPLLPFIRERSVQRKAFSTQPLSPAQKQALEAAAAPHHRVHWIEGFWARLRFAKMLFHSARLRLILPEAYATHCAIIEWDASASRDRIPDQALGASPTLLKTMRFALRSWARVDFLNRWLAGTWVPRIELDFLPGLHCAAHFLLHATRAPRTIDDYVAAGRAAQRFWLTAQQLGLQLQPEITPLVFARYARERPDFSVRAEARALAPRIRARFEELVGADLALRTTFMGRVGSGERAAARSTRMSLQELMLPIPARQEWRWQRQLQGAPCRYWGVLRPEMKKARLGRAFSAWQISAQALLRRRTKARPNIAPPSSARLVGSGMTLRRTSMSLRAP